MKRIFPAALFCVALTCAALTCAALSPRHAEAQEIYSPDAHCAVIRNETKDKSFVSIRTAFYEKRDGKRSYYEEVMHIKPQDERQICVKGPFYPGYKVTLMIKSFFPLFECRTRLAGTIYIREKKRADGNRDFYATCID